jgi:hypothetical protein
MERQTAQDPWQRVIAELKQERDIQFDEGLSDAEVNGCEHRFGFRFPPGPARFPPNGATPWAAVPGLAKW